MGKPAPTQPAARLSAGRWIDILCIALIIAFAFLLARSAAQGLWIVDRSGAPTKADFSAFWGAARLTWLGHAERAYDWSAVRALIEHMSGKSFPSGEFPFFYPPLMLLILAPLGALAYAPAAALWVSATFAAYLRAAFAVMGMRGALIAAAAPAALWSICVGQNGLLSAALLGGALVLLERRPAIAGVLLAALSFKPQLGMLIPFVLIASGRWHALASASIALVALWLIAGAAFGFGIYQTFLHAEADAGHRLMVAGGLPWFKMQSFYGLLRVLGVPPVAANIFQAGASLLIAAGAALLWRSHARFTLKAAALAIGTLAVSPYVQIYDFPIVSLAILFLAADGKQCALRASEIAALIGAFLLPLIYDFIRLPVGPLIFLLLGAVIAARAVHAPEAEPSRVENLAGA